MSCVIFVSTLSFLSNDSGNKLPCYMRDKKTTMTTDPLRVIDMDLP